MDVLRPALRRARSLKFAYDTEHRRREKGIQDTLHQESELLMRAGVETLWPSSKGRVTDALAPAGDEGRGKLR